MGPVVLNSSIPMRPGTMNGHYDSAMLTVSNVQSANNGVKTEALGNSRMYTGDFIQVFNLRVKCGP